MLANYHAKVERKVFQLPLDLDPGEKLAAIAKIAVGSCPKAKTKTSFYNSTRYKTLFYNSARYRGGWSPHGSCQNATIFHGRKKETPMVNTDGYCHWDQRDMRRMGEETEPNPLCGERATIHGAHSPFWSMDSSPLSSGKQKSSSRADYMADNRET